MGEILEVQEKDFNEILSNNKVVLVDFWTPSCRPCKAMQPVLGQLAGSLEGKLKVIKVNAEQEQSVVTRCDVQGVPTLVLFRDGQEVGRKTGYVQGSDLKKWVEDYLD